MDNALKPPFGTADPYPLQPYSKLIINAALTGMVPMKRHTPHIPVTPEEIIEQGIECVHAGASILHLHAREADERPTWKPEIYAKIIEGIRNECPMAILCVTTSGREFNTFEKRSAVLELDGDVKPDMASLTLGSLNFPGQASINDPAMIMGLAGRMKDKGIKPELEIFDTGMINTAKYLCHKGLIDHPFYFNILLGSIYSTQATMSDLTNLVHLLPPDAVWAGAGIGVFQLVVNTAAVVMGGHVRVGLEDNIWYDHGKTRPATNAELIRRVMRIAREFGRDSATPLEARQRLQLGVPFPKRAVLVEAPVEIPAERL
jgi:3-keto-5-aminohexanoate cleavage enzyme